MIKKPDLEFPPDRPSPIPAWQHYYISKYAEERVLAELGSRNSDSLMAGLGIGYLFVPAEERKDDPENRFCMSYGYWIDCKNAEVAIEPSSEEDEQKDGLDDEFMEALYEDVKGWILEAAPAEPAGRYMVSVEVTTVHCSTPKLDCKGEKCDWCAQHGKWHRFKKKKNQAGTACVWECKNKDCEN